MNDEEAVFLTFCHSRESLSEMDSPFRAFLAG